MTKQSQILRLGDCNKILGTLKSQSVDLFYIDPPFFTQKRHALATRDGATRYSFRDIWKSREAYGEFLIAPLRECYRCLKDTGSLFFHCDDNAGYIARMILDDIFGLENFNSEIIWSFKRWSNSKKGLLPSHQTIFFYSRSRQFKFNPIKTAYSESTNVDQILQKRVRDTRGKTVYARDEAGEPVSNGAKLGVPLGDVWEIPYLNPKAKERVGYPTQKPILLLERIIQMCTDPGDLVVDPFCGSGTTVVAAKLLGRKAIGIDVSQEALALAKVRLANPVKTESKLLENGRESYVRADLGLLKCLEGIEFHPVQRNKGIDAILAEEWHGQPVCVRIQRRGESIDTAAALLCKAAQKKGGAKLILVVTNSDCGLDIQTLPQTVSLVRATVTAVRESLTQCKEGETRARAGAVSNDLGTCQ